MFKKIKLTDIITNDNFLNTLPLVGIFISLLSVICITITSDIIFTTPNYEGFKNFTEYYEFPLKTIIIFLTAFGILVAYKSYLQTKEMFFILNRPQIYIEKFKPHFLPQGNRFQPILDIKNEGNAPATNIEIKLLTIIDNISIPPNVEIEHQVSLLPEKSLHLGFTYDEVTTLKMTCDKEIPIFLNIKYRGLSNKKYETIAEYIYVNPETNFRRVKENYI